MLLYISFMILLGSIYIKEAQELHVGCVTVFRLRCKYVELWQHLER